jgi:hypothetical protein
MSEMIALGSEEEALTQLRAFLRRSTAADASRLRRLLADRADSTPTSESSTILGFSMNGI